MKNYVVTFSKDAIRYDFNKQQEAIKNSLGDNTYLSQLNEDISFETIDREVENALINKFDNFICLAEDEDVDMLQSGLEEEYGDKFKKILVIPEAFTRLREGDMGQTANTPTENNSQKIPISEKDFTQIQQKIIEQLSVSSTKINISNLDIFTKKESIATLTAKKYIVLAIVATSNKATLQTQVDFGSTIGIYSEIEIERNASTPINYEELQSNYNIHATVSKNQRSGGQPVVLTLTSEKAISNASNILVYLISTSYPFVDKISEMCNDIQQTISAHQQNNVEVRYMLCGPINGLEFLPSTSLLELAKKIPNGNIENLLGSAGIDNTKLLDCGSPSETNIITTLQNLVSIAPNVKNIWVRVPKGIGNFNMLKTGGILTTPQNTSIKIVEVTEGLQQFDGNRNTPVYQNLSELVKTKNKDFEGAKTFLGDTNKNNEENTDFAEKTSNLSDKERQAQIKNLQSELKKNPYDLEIQSGWPEFILALVEATILYLKKPEETPIDQKEVDGAIKEMMDTIMAPIVSDLKAWKGMLDDTGFGYLIDAGMSIVKGLTKSLGKETKETKKFKHLIETEAYKNIKKAFGGGDIDINSFILANETGTKLGILKAQNQVIGNK